MKMKLTKRDAKELKIVQVVLLVVLVVGLLITGWFAWGPPAHGRRIDSFESCMRYEKEVLAIYPAVCMTKDGRRFTDPNYDHCAVEPTPSSDCIKLKGGRP